MEACQHGRTSTAVLMESLKHAEQGERAGLCRALVSVGEAEGICTVMEQMHLLGAVGMDLVSARQEAAEEAVRRVAARGHVQARRNVLEWIGHHRALRYAGTTAGMLGGGERQLSRRAAEVMLELAEAAGGKNHGGPMEDVERLDEAIVEGLEGYREHRQREVLVAAAIRLPSATPRLKARLADANEYMAMAVRSVPDDWTLAVVRRHLLVWLGDEVLGRRAGAALARLAGTEAWAEVLARAHVLMDPKKRAALRAIRLGGRAIPGWEMVAQMPVSAQAMYPRFIMAVGLSSQVRVEKLGACVLLPNPLARLNALRELCGHRTAQAAAAIAEFGTDSEKTIARMAKRMMMTEVVKTGVMVEVKPAEGVRARDQRGEQSDRSETVMMGRVVSGAET